MSPALNWRSPRTTRFPRVSGDEPEALNRELAQMTFSPRERG